MKKDTKRRQFQSINLKLKYKTKRTAKDGEKRQCFMKKRRIIGYKSSRTYIMANGRSIKSDNSHTRRCGDIIKKNRNGSQTNDLPMRDMIPATFCIKGLWVSDTASMGELRMTPLTGLPADFLRCPT